jgi:RNA polymerase sigma-70 factor (ECF subfamily)
MSQGETIEKIRLGGQAELGLVYEEHRDEFLAWIIREYRCSREDSLDIYQMTILIFHDNIKSGKLEHLVSSIKTYLFGIGKNIAREFSRRKARMLPIDQEAFLRKQIVDEPDEPEYEESFQLARRALQKLGDPCRKLIELFYYEKKSITEIADEMDYKNPETAKNQKCKCMARLRKLVEQDNNKNTTVISHESI